MKHTNEKEPGPFKSRRDENLQITLLKMVAEQNHEMFIEYSRDTDTAVFYEVKNGCFVTKEVIEECLTHREKITSRVAEEDRELYTHEIWKGLERPMSRVFDVRYYDRNGEKKWHRIFMVSIADEDRKVTKLAARIMSVHKEKMATELLRIEAERDSLTGVYNHKTFEEVARDIIRRHGDTMAFILVDTDDFKSINDKCGHHIGDKILKKIGEVIKLAVQGRGIAGRLGGDSFAVCAYQFRGQEDAVDFCTRIREALKKPVDDVEYTVSIGAVMGQGKKLTYDQMYYQSDRALCFGKENGKNRIVFAEDLDRLNREKTQRQDWENTLTEEEIALDQMTDYRIVADVSNKSVLYINKAAREVLGISQSEIEGLTCYGLCHGRNSACDVCELRSTHVDCFGDDRVCGLQKYLPKGRFLIHSAFCYWKGKPARMIGFLDFTDDRYMEQYFRKEHEFHGTLNRCWDAVISTADQEMAYNRLLTVMNQYYDADCCAIITKQENAYKDIYEYHKPRCESLAEGLKKSIHTGDFEKLEILIDEDGYMRRRHIEKVLEKNEELANILKERMVQSTLGIKLARGEEFAGILLVLNPRHHTEDYKLVKRVGIFLTADLQRKQLSDHRIYERSHDMLTRMWNRSYFTEWLTKYNATYEKNFGVFTVDILHLADINREFGYDGGNEIIIEVADVFRRVFSGYSMFRYDDDQILVVCHKIDKAAFQKLIDYAREQLEETNIDLAIGYYWVQDGEVMEGIRMAEDYLVRDKERLALVPQQEGKMLNHVMKGVQDSIDNGSFQVYLQPKVSIGRAKTVGAEALIRLFDHVHGLVSPAYFIPILEERGIIYMVDLFVLEEVFRFQQKSIKEGRVVVPISVNFSKNTLMYPQLVRRISELHDKYPIPEGLIQVEITETISTMDHMLVTEIASSLRNMGFSVSMDDFGTKYSNMAVLTQFEFDAVKIDRSLLQNIEKNKKNVTILRHTLGMMEELGIDTVMEGAETKEQIEILRELGCDVVQGYYYGRPQHMDHFYELYM